MPRVGGKKRKGKISAFGYIASAGRKPDLIGDKEVVCAPAASQHKADASDFQQRQSAGGRLQRKKTQPIDFSHQSARPSTN